MPLRVAFDLDGTLANMHYALGVEADRLFGPAPAPTPTRDQPQEAADEPRGGALRAERQLSRAERTRLWDHVKGIENFWDSLPEMEPGIVARIASAASARRWDVVFLTTRPLVAGDTVQVQSQRWLQAQGFTLPSVFVVQRSRGKIAEALDLDAVVDDRPENCVDVAIDSKATAILVWRSAAKVPQLVERMSIRVAPSISDALQLLVKIDDQRQPRVTRTLRKLFGKETTA